MPRDLSKTYIYHITDIENLPRILAAGGLLSDVALAGAGGAPVKIGYDHIKLRRMETYRIHCAGGKFVGQFVPFYYCPRSPMLYTINLGNTGRPRGCQKTIVHLVSTVQDALNLGRQWAISDCNAGSGYADFFDDVEMLERLDWASIEANQWRGKMSQKMAEFLVEDFFPWAAVRGIGCYDTTIADRVTEMFKESAHKPSVLTKPNWYY